MSTDSTDDAGRLDPRIQEALEDLQEYLSDLIPPLFFVDSIQQLFGAPPRSVAAQIMGWSTNQYSASGPLPTADYLFHAAKKINLLSELELFPKEAIKEFLARLQPELLAVCPEGDRASLKADLERLDLAVGVGGGAGVDLLYQRSGQTQDRPGSLRTTRTEQGASTVGSSEVSSSFAQGLKKLDILLGNLQHRVAVEGSDGSAPSRDTFKRLTGEVVTQASTLVHSSEEMEQLLVELGRRGLPVSTDRIVPMLAANLPDWAPTELGDTGRDASPQAGVRAMGHFVSMAKDEGERRNRHSELVETAVAEFNSGSLGRAVTLLDLATSMIEQKEVDTLFAESVQRQAFAKLEMSQVQKLAEDKENRLLLRRFLNFFPSLRPSELLAQLDGEPDRHKRKFLLDLLRVHGEDARSLAFSELVAVQAGEKFFHWFFTRNLIHLLRTIPRGSADPVESEIDVLIPFTGLDNELALIREALATFSQLPHERAVTNLAARVNEVEQILLSDEPHTLDRDQLLTLLDTLIRLLSNIKTQAARRYVVVHALKRNTRLGNTIERLKWLAEQDLSDDRDLVTRLINEIRHELPKGLLNFSRKSEKKQQSLEAMVRSLASTHSRQVEELMAEISEKHANLPIASTAAEILAQRQTATPRRKEAEPTLSGDLSLFGLPNLLQNLADSQIGGLLKVLGPAGGTAARIWMKDGLVVAADAGKLRGEVAVYQLLEDPAPGQFTFGDSTEEPDADALAQKPMSVQSVLFEGVRRYDEFNRAAALVPDDAALGPTGAKPTPPEGETDGDLVRQVWLLASAGCPPTECESEVATDRYRIRSLYEHWVTEGSLAFSESTSAPA